MNVSDAISNVITGSSVSDIVSGNVSEVVSGGVADAPVNCLESTWQIWIIYAVIIAAFYFLMIRPQSKRRKKEESMRRNIEVGDEIVTIGGIVGRVISVREDEKLIIETGVDRVKICVKNWAVGQNLTIKDQTPVTEEPKGLAEKIKGFFQKK